MTTQSKQTIPSPRRIWLRRGLLAGIPALALAMSAAAVAHGGPRGGHGGPMGVFAPRMIERVLDHVDATADQRSRIKSILERNREAHKAQRAEHRKLRQAMMQALAAPSIDTGKIESLRQQGLTLMERDSKVMTSVAVEVANVLTPAQRAKIAAHLQKRFEKHAGDFDDAQD